jgi:hypothetical protein
MGKWMLTKRVWLLEIAIRLKIRYTMRSANVKAVVARPAWCDGSKVGI